MSLFLRNIAFAVLAGSIAAIIVNGAIVLAVYNLPEDILPTEANDAKVKLAIVAAILVLAALLPTAPLIEWWHNRLSSWLSISWND